MSALYDALTDDDKELVRSLLRNGATLTEAEYDLLTDEQKALLEAIKSELAAEEEEDNRPRP